MYSVFRPDNNYTPEREIDIEMPSDKISIPNGSKYFQYTYGASPLPRTIANNICNSIKTIMTHTGCKTFYWGEKTSTEARIMTEYPINGWKGVMNILPKNGLVHTGGTIMDCERKNEIYLVSQEIYLARDCEIYDSLNVTHKDQIPLPFGSQWELVFSAICFFFALTHLIMILSEINRIRMGREFFNKFSVTIGYIFLSFNILAFLFFIAIGTIDIIKEERLREREQMNSSFPYNGSMYVPSWSNQTFCGYMDSFERIVKNDCNNIYKSPCSGTNREWKGMIDFSYVIRDTIEGYDGVATICTCMDKEVNTTELSIGFFTMGPVCIKGREMERIKREYISPPLGIAMDNLLVLVGSILSLFYFLMFVTEIWVLRGNLEEMNRKMAIWSVIYAVSFFVTFVLSGYVTIYDLAL